jgi:hypothetical protein
MATLSHTFTRVTAPGESSANFRSKRDQEVTIVVNGTIDADCSIVLEQNDGRGAAWRPIRRWAAGAHSDSYGFTGTGTEWRFRAEVGEEATLADVSVGLADVVRDLQVWRDNDGGVAAKVQDTGITAKSVSANALAGDSISEKTSGAGVTVDGVLLKDSTVKTDTIVEKTAAAGVTADGVLLKDGGITLLGGPAQFPRGQASSVILAGFGATAAEGLQLLAVDEVVSFAANAALYKELTYLLPAGTVLLSAQANVNAALTGGGTTAKVGLGTEADPDLWGKTADLTKNAKISTIPDWAILAAPTAVRLSSCAADGSAGDTALTVGSVRVRLIFLVPTDLASVA